MEYGSAAQGGMGPCMIGAELSWEALAALAFAGEVVLCLDTLAFSVPALRRRFSCSKGIVAASTLSRALRVVLVRLCCSLVCLTCTIEFLALLEAEDVGRFELRVGTSSCSDSSLKEASESSSVVASW